TAEPMSPVPPVTNTRMFPPVMRLLSHHCRSDETRVASRIWWGATLDPRTTRAAGRRRRRPVQRAGLRCHDGGADRRTGGRDQEHLLPLLRRQARRPRRRPGNLSPPPRRRQRRGLERATAAMAPGHRDLAPRLRAAVAAHTELQKRDALERVGLAAAMATALVARGVPDPVAHLAAEMGTLAFQRAYETWAERGADSDLGQLGAQGAGRTAKGVHCPGNNQTFPDRACAARPCTGRSGGLPGSAACRSVEFFSTGGCRHMMVRRPRGAL